MSRAFRQVAATTLTGSRRSQPIRIVTYNILAEKYSGNNSYCPEKFLKWSYRFELLLNRLEAYSPDLLCLQEVQEDVYEAELRPWMQQHGYTSLYHPRHIAAGSTTRGPRDGVSLHFRDDLFSLQASQAVRFADHATQLVPTACCSFHEALQQRRPDRVGSTFVEAFLQREEGAVMALLQHKPSQQQLVACSIHLHWNPNFPDIKLAQAAVLCHCIANFIAQQQQQEGQQFHSHSPMGQQQPPAQQQQQQGTTQTGSSTAGGIPVVVGGDFNSTWRKFSSDAWDKVPFGASITSGVYDLMSQGQVGPSHADHPSNRRLCSSCSKLEDRGRARAGGQQQQQQQQQGQQQRVQHQQDPQPGKQQQQQQQADHLLGYTFTTSGLQLESSQFSAHGREPTLTTRSSSFSGCLDYIWLSKQHWQVQSTLELPFQEPGGKPGPPERVAAFGPCPNAEQPSDHLAIGCEAVLLPVPKGAAVVQTRAAGSSGGRVQDKVLG